MFREDFIALVEELGLPYKEAKIGLLRDKEYDGIYVYNKHEYEMFVKDPKKYKNLYVPYIRVSDFGSEMYVRDNGYCYYTNDYDLKLKLQQMAVVKGRP